MRIAALMIVVSLALAGGGSSATVLQQSTETTAALDVEAINAYRAKDYARFLELEKRALELSPSTPRFIYNVACGEALQGNGHEAVRLLDQLLARKLDLGAATDEDFAGIRNTS